MKRIQFEEKKKEAAEAREQLRILKMRQKEQAMLEKIDDDEDEQGKEGNEGKSVSYQEIEQIEPTEPDESNEFNEGPGDEELETTIEPVNSRREPYFPDHLILLTQDKQLSETSKLLFDFSVDAKIEFYLKTIDLKTSKENMKTVDQLSSELNHEIRIYLERVD
jgi:hypothetical protein